MTSTITCPDLGLLASGEFAVRDSSLCWRFLKQGEGGFSCEVASTPARIAMLSTAKISLSLHQMPGSFKAGFVRAFYGLSSANGSLYHNSRSPHIGEQCGNELDRLMLRMGLKLGRQASWKTRRRYALEVVASPIPEYWCKTPDHHFLVESF